MGFLNERVWGGMSQSTPLIYNSSHLKSPTLATINHHYNELLMHHFRSRRAPRNLRGLIARVNIMILNLYLMVFLMGNCLLYLTLFEWKDFIRCPPGNSSSSIKLYIVFFSCHAKNTVTSLSLQFMFLIHESIGNNGQVT